MTKNRKNTHSCLVSDLRGKAVNLSTLSMMLAMDFHGYPIPICMKGCWVESHSFYVSFEMSMYFNSFFLLILHQYNITWLIFVLKHHGSWCIILFYVFLESIASIMLRTFFNYRYIYKGYWFTVFIFYHVDTFGFRISVILPSQSELWSIPSFSIFFLKIGHQLLI